MSPILMGTLGGLVAATATAAGALPAMFGRSMSQRMADTLLGFAAGVMLSAAYFSLILPGIEVAEELYGSVVLAAGVAGIGIALGALFVWSLDKVLPHEHFKTGREGADAGPSRPDLAVRDRHHHPQLARRSVDRRRLRQRYGQGSLGDDRDLDPGHARGARRGGRR